MLQGLLQVAEGLASLSDAGCQWPLGPAMAESRGFRIVLFYGSTVVSLQFGYNASRGTDLVYSIVLLVVRQTRSQCLFLPCALADALRSGPECRDLRVQG